MVVFLRRPGGQSEFSATLEAQTRESRPLGDLLGWLPDHLRRELSVEELARRAAMSPRSFARLFRQELGKTPGKHIEDLRLEAARLFLKGQRGPAHGRRGGDRAEEMGRLDGLGPFSGGADGRGLDGVRQLTNVAPPFGGLDRPQGARRELTLGQPVNALRVSALFVRPPASRPTTRRSGQKH